MSLNLIFSRHNHTADPKASRTFTAKTNGSNTILKCGRYPKNSISNNININEITQSLSASATVKITAPLPRVDVSEFPKLLVAKTCAYILEPHGRLKGAALSVLVGMLHFAVDKIVVSAPLQSGVVLKVTPSLCLIFIV